jgi:hypothetical protein
MNSPPLFFRHILGFSTIAPIMFTLQKKVHEDSLKHFFEKDIGSSILNNSTTLIIDTSTGDKIPHFVDQDDYNTDFGSSGSPPILLLQPAVPLKHNTRYIVLVQNMKDIEGQLISPSALYAQIRDGTPTSSDDINLRINHYKNSIFPTLVQHISGYCII